MIEVVTQYQQADYIPFNGIGIQVSQHWDYGISINGGPG